MLFETAVSKDIRIISEVEKIWIIYDLDENGTLDRNELVDYIKTMAYPNLDVTDEQIDEIFNVIDTDGDGAIEKHEMELFLHVMMTI